MVIRKTFHYISIIAFFTTILISNNTAAKVNTVSNIWIEAEDFQDTNWSPGRSIMINADGSGASNGMYLKLYSGKSDNMEKILPYYAQYRFKVVKEGDYVLWMGASPQSASWCASVYYSIDGLSFTNLAGKAPSGASYGSPHPYDYFFWTSVKKVYLTAGIHNMRIEVRKSRDADDLYACFMDAFLFTTDTGFTPKTNHPEYSAQPTWQDRMKKTTFADYIASLYYNKIKDTNEDVNEKTIKEVTRKIMARALPHKDSRKGIHRFGVHGMETDFIVAGENDAQAELAFEMLARVGVNTLRTAESCWHRLGVKYDNFKQMDYQAAMAGRYGMNFMLTVGYPPIVAALGGGHTTFKPGYELQFRDYIRTVLNRYKNVSQYIEYGNEVDAPDVWWTGATADMYFRDICIVKEEMSRLTPDIPLVAFAATYSRDDSSGGEKGGRRFIDRCFELGINKYADAYSIHYTWGLDQRDFPAYIRREMSEDGIIKPIINSEETGYGQPYDVIKLFARDLFLYDMESVYYYLSMDWFEAGNLVTCGLFDLNWKPKLRLLAYAASVDAMDNRELLGMAEPASGIEAYVLGYEQGYEGAGPKYSIVMWRTVGAHEIASESMDATIAVTGFTGVVSAYNWKLDQIKIDNQRPSVNVGEAPVMIGVSTLPDWKLIPSSEWLSSIQ